MKVAKMSASGSKRKGRPMQSEHRRQAKSRSRSPLRAVPRRSAAHSNRRPPYRPQRVGSPFSPVDEFASTRTDREVDEPRRVVRDFLIKRRQTSLDLERSVSGLPSMAVVTQPEKNVRARYVSEGNRAPIRGRSEGAHTYPSVQIKGYSGPAVVDVFLVNPDDESPHQNILVRSTNTTDACEEVTLPGAVAAIRVQVDASTKMRAVFDNLSIRRLRKVEIDQRYAERGIVPATSSEQKDPADRSSACLKFVARIPGLGGEETVLETISEKLQCVAPQESSEIHLVSPAQGPVEGGYYVTLVGKRFKAGFKVRVYSEEPNDSWEEWANVNRDFSNQGAAVFTVPAFSNTDIKVPTTVQIQVKTGTENAPLFSDSVSFTYTPRTGVLCEQCNSVVTTQSNSPEPAVEASYPPTPQSVPQSTCSPPMLIDDNSLSAEPAFAVGRQQQSLKIEAPVPYPALAGLMTPTPSPAPVMNNPTTSTFSSFPETRHVHDLVDENDFQMSIMDLLTDTNTTPDLGLPADFLTSTAVTLSLPTPVDSTANMLNIGELASMPRLPLTSADLLGANMGSTMSLSPPADVTPKPLPKPLDISTEEDWKVIDGVIKRLENIMPQNLMKPFTYLIVIAKSRDSNLLKIFYRCQQECLASNEPVDHAVLRMQKKLLNILPVLAQQTNGLGSNLLQPQAATGRSH